MASNLANTTAAVVALAALTGCTLTVPTPTYAPATTAELSGQVEVKPFAYDPIHPEGPTAIYNTGPGTLNLSEPVDGYVTTAVQREFRQAGISLKPGGCVLTGRITDLSIDDTGFTPVAYHSAIDYTLSNGKGPILAKGYETSFTTDKQLETAAIATYVAKAVSDNIGKLLSDPEVQDAITAECAK